MSTTGTSGATGKPSAAPAAGNAPVVTIDPSKPVPQTIDTNPSTPLLQAVDIAFPAGIPTVGVYTFQVVVTDDLNQQASAQAQVTVRGRPNVQITAPQVVAQGAQIPLSATASSPGGSITNFAWTLQSVTLRT